MTETKNIHEDTGWYASYEKSKQGKALILCQQLKIKQLTDLIKIIQGEIELTENPQEYSYQSVIQSIRGIIETIPTISYQEGIYKWEG